MPGPVCYGRGGTVADGDRRRLVLGYHRSREFRRRPHASSTRRRPRRRCSDIADRLELIADGMRERHRQDRRVPDGRHHSQDDRRQRASIRATSCCSPSAAPGRRTRACSRAELGVQKVVIPQTRDRLDLVRLRRRRRPTSCTSTSRSTSWPRRSTRSASTAISMLLEEAARAQMDEGRHCGSASAPAILARHAPQGPDQRGRGDARAGAAPRAVSRSPCGEAFYQTLRAALRHAAPRSPAPRRDRHVPPARHGRDAAPAAVPAASLIKTIPPAARRPSAIDLLGRAERVR